MSATGGPLKTVSINGRPFKFAGDATPAVKLGGKEVVYEPNGDETARKLFTPVPWSVTGCVVEIDSDNQDFEYLKDAQVSVDDIDISIEYAGGLARAGAGGITGELTEDNSKATASFDISGPGELKRL